jgi:hypothetical protein
MKKTIFSVMLLAAALLPAGCVQTVTSKDTAIPLHRENIEWCDVWYANTTKADKPAVMIVGDSISKGYGGVVEQSLAGKAYMARLSTSRGICDPCLLDELRAMVRHHQFAVVHFNNGLHGADYTDAEYEAGYRKVVKLLQTETNGAKVILASSTFVLPGWRNWGKTDEANRKMIEARNAIAKRLAAEAGIPFNDLGAVTDGHPDYYNASDKIHYNGTGYAKLGAKVSEAILGELQNRKSKD